jgi:hypothetical protein
MSWSQQELRVAARAQSKDAALVTRAPKNSPCGRALQPASRLVKYTRCNKATARKGDPRAPAAEALYCLPKGKLGRLKPPLVVPLFLGAAAFTFARRHASQGACG